MLCIGGGQDFVCRLVILVLVVPVVVARLLRLPAGQRVTLTMTTTARNSPLTLSIAVAAFPDRPLIAVALVIGPLMELPIVAVLSQVVRHRDGRKGQSTETFPGGG